MARLPDAPGDGPVAARMRARRGGDLYALDRMLLHSPPVADGWNALLGAIRERTTLPADVRELVILRVAVLNGAPYEWATHEPVGRAAGLSDTELAVAQAGTGLESLGAGHRAALAYADAMTRDVEVPDEVFDALSAHFDARQTVELTATVGTYNLVSRFLVALDVGHGAPEAGGAGERA